MGRMRLAGTAVLTIGLLYGSVMPAHAQQTFNFTLGGFVPSGPDGRAHDDVLVANHDYLAFHYTDFNGVTTGGEWLVAAGPVIEFGAGAAFYQRTVPTIYRDFVGSDNSEIEQSLRLRMVPVAFTVRIVPTGQRSPVQPYLGAGIAIVNWHYSEFGDFVDFGTPNRVIRPGTFAADGTSVGPVVLGGLRFALGAMSVGGEVRYQHAAAELGNSFAAPTLDLGGWTYQATLGLRLGR